MQQCWVICRFEGMARISTKDKAGGCSTNRVICSFQHAKPFLASSLHSSLTGGLSFTQK